MSWRAGGAIAALVVAVACLVVHGAPRAQAFVSPPRPVMPADAALLLRAADSGVDIVRMPPRPPTSGQPPSTPAAQQPPSVPPPVAPPPSQAPRPPQPPGRIVKLTTKIGSQSTTLKVT